MHRDLASAEVVFVIRGAVVRGGERGVGMLIDEFGRSFITLAGNDVLALILSLGPSVVICSILVIEVGIVVEEVTLVKVMLIRQVNYIDLFSVNIYRYLLAHGFLQPL